MDTAGLRDLGEYVATSLSDYVRAADVVRDELVVDVRADRVVRVLKFLKDDTRCRFEQLTDLCGVDYPGARPALRCRLSLAQHEPQSTTAPQDRRQRGRARAVGDGVYASAGWWEREAWDLYGIYFAGNPDLRRLLTDYGFDGHPLRKDFPLTGYVELRYDSEQKRVVYEPVKLTQEFRRFDFLSPWEGASYPLPGDEKAEPEADEDGRES